MVFLLTIAATLSFIDRQILNVMIGPIKRDLGGLSDTEISLIIGLAFSAVYSLTTLPLARIADRYSRRNVIAAGIFSWSLDDGFGRYGKFFLAVVHSTNGGWDR